eukprot:1543103-Ditylum_brightwellii.AAC.1
MAKTRTNRIDAGAPENNETPLLTADTPMNSTGGNATGAAMGGAQQHTRTTTLCGREPFWQQEDA